MCNITVYSFAFGLIMFPSITLSQTEAPKHGTKTAAKMDQAAQELLQLLSKNNKDLNGLLIDAAKDIREALTDIVGANNASSNKNPLGELQKAITDTSIDAADHETGKAEKIAQALVDAFKQSDDPLVKWSAIGGDSARRLIQDGTAIALNLRNRAKLMDTISTHLEKSNATKWKSVAKELEGVVHRAHLLDKQLSQAASQGMATSGVTKQDVLQGLASKSPSQLRIVDPTDLSELRKIPNINPDFIGALERERQLWSAFGTQNMSIWSQRMYEAIRYSDGGYIPAFGKPQHSSVKMSYSRQVQSKSPASTIFELSEMPGFKLKQSPMQDSEKGYFGSGSANRTKAASLAWLDTQQYSYDAFRGEISFTLYDDREMTKQHIGLPTPGDYTIKTNVIGGGPIHVHLDGGRHYEFLGPLCYLRIEGSFNWVLRDPRGQVHMQYWGNRFQGDAVPGKYTIFISDARYKSGDPLPADYISWKSVAFEVKPGTRLTVVDPSGKVTEMSHF